MTISVDTLSGGKSDLLNLVLSNQKTQALVVSGTTGLAIDYNIMSWLPPTLTLIGSCIGIVVGIMMIRVKSSELKHNKIIYKISLKKLKDMD
ncbi:MAG: hypothetical protein COB36_11930 [Alphaproteobacteria bacterium]|nr:MAG: hypothetical protein COB36_11930 [Alphaproteobacteria bacterium]